MLYNKFFFDDEELACPFCESENVEVKGKEVLCLRCHAACQVSIDYDYKEELLRHFRGV